MRIQRHSLYRNQRSGFTLVELLIVVVVAGVLASIAVPKFAHARTMAVTATAKSDLRNLLIAQESHFNDHRTFSGDLAELAVVPSSQVTIRVLESTASGWSATATYPHGQCAIYYGSAAPVAPATVSTVVNCD